MSVDTLSPAKELRAAELSSTQAEAIGRAVEGAATKGDVDQAKLELRGEIEKLRSTLIMWFVGTTITLAAIIIAVVKL